MADIAGVRNLQSVRRCRSDEVKRVAPHVDVGNGLLDLGHVASDALVALATRFVMGVFLNGWRVWPIRRIRAMTIQAQNVCRFPQQCIVLRTMSVVTSEAGNAVGIHGAGNEVVALHAILVGGSVGEMRERCFAEFVLFQFPEIVQTLAHLESDGPVISLSRGGSSQGLPLRMALYASIGCVNIVEARRVHYIRWRWLLHVLAAWAVTFFAADIPLTHLLGGYIIID